MRMPGGPQDPPQTKRRITRSASSREDEGIVQSAAKAAGELSPRLHQRSVPGSRAGNAILYRDGNTVRTLTDGEAAYIAGIVDGEGTVSLERHHGGEHRRPVVSVANTDYALLAYLKATIGAGRITSKCVAKKHHTPSFVFAIYSRQALELLKQINRYLRTYKRARAELLLQQYLLVVPRNGRYTAELLAARAAMEASFFALRIRGSECAVAAGTGSGAHTFSVSEHARSSARHA